MEHIWFQVMEERGVRQIVNLIMLLKHLNIVKVMLLFVSMILYKK